MSNSVKHTKNALVISIATNQPAELQEQLLRAVNTVLKQHLLHPIEDVRAAQAVASLAELQQAMIPDADGLEKIFAA